MQPDASIPHVKSLSLQVNARFISSNVRRLQLLDQDDDYSNKKNKIDLSKEEKHLKRMSHWV